METFWTIVKILGAILVLSQLIAPIFVLKRIKRIHSELPNMSTADLRALALKEPFVHCSEVLDELSSRDEDISFALPLLFELAVRKLPAAYIVGWGGLKRHFSDQLPNFDFSKSRPNPEERNFMKLELDRQPKAK